MVEYNLRIGSDLVMEGVILDYLKILNLEHFYYEERYNLNLTIDQNISFSFIDKIYGKIILKGLITKDYIIINHETNTVIKKINNKVLVINNVNENIDEIDNNLSQLDYYELPIDINTNFVNNFDNSAIFF